MTVYDWQTKKITYKGVKFTLNYSFSPKKHVFLVELWDSSETKTLWQESYDPYHFASLGEMLIDCLDSYLCFASPLDVKYKDEMEYIAQQWDGNCDFIDSVEVHDLRDGEQFKEKVRMGNSITKGQDSTKTGATGWEAVEDGGVRTVYPADDILMVYRYNMLTDQFDFSVFKGAERLPSWTKSYKIAEDGYLVYDDVYKDYLNERNEANEASEAKGETE